MTRLGRCATISVPRERLAHCLFPVQRGEYANREGTSIWRALFSSRGRAAMTFSLLSSRLVARDLSKPLNVCHHRRAQQLLLRFLWTPSCAQSVPAHKSSHSLKPEWLCILDVRAVPTCGTLLNVVTICE